MNIPTASNMSILSRLVKPLKLTAGHHPPKEPSLEYLCDMAWLKGFGSSHAPANKGLKAGDQAEEEFLNSLNERENQKRN